MIYPATQIINHCIESNNEMITQLFENEQFLIMLQKETKQQEQEENFKKLKNITEKNPPKSNKKFKNSNNLPKGKEGLRRIPRRWSNTGIKFRRCYNF